MEAVEPLQSVIGPEHIEEGEITHQSPSNKKRKNKSLSVTQTVGIARAKNTVAKNSSMDDEGFTTVSGKKSARLARVTTNHC